MEELRNKIKKDVKLRQHLDLISKIAKAEYKTTSSSHVIEFDELINIGIHTVDILCNSKAHTTINDSYIATAIKWAIRNELRRRYRWRGVKYGCKESEGKADEIREAVYKTILSTDELFENDKPFEIQDERKTPEENCEFGHMSDAIKSAISSLPKRERDLIESKFFKEKKLHELSDEFDISPSRISRIIKSGLDKVKDLLVKSGVV